MLPLRKKGDLSAKITLALLADSPNPQIRDILEQELYRDQCKENGRAVPIFSKEAVQEQMPRIIEEKAQILDSSPKATGVVPPSSPTINPKPPVVAKHGITLYTPKSYRTCSTYCICGMGIDYPDSISGLSVPCPSCGRAIQIPGQRKQTYRISDKSSFSYPHGAISFLDQKSKNYISSPQMFLPLIKKIYQKRKKIDLITVFLTISLSAGILFPLGVIETFSFLHIAILLAGILLAFIAHKFIVYDIVRDLLPLLKYQHNTQALHGFKDFLSCFLDTLQKIGVHERQDKSCGVYGYKKQTLGSTQKILSYRFGENAQMLLFSDLAIFLYNGEFQITGLYSIDFNVTENMNISSRVTDYTYYWLHQRRDGGPDRRYKQNYQIKTPCRYGLTTNISYDYKLIVDGICFEGNSADISLLNKIISQWNNSSF